MNREPAQHFSFEVPAFTCRHETSTLTYSLRLLWSCRPSPSLPCARATDVSSRPVGREKMKVLVSSTHTYAHIFSLEVPAFKVLICKRHLSHTCPYVQHSESHVPMRIHIRRHIRTADQWSPTVTESCVLTIQQIK